MRSEKLDSLVVGDILRERSVTHRAEVFLKFHDGELSYGDVDSMVDRVAGGLAAQGIGNGHHVAVMLPNSPEILFTIFALSRLGAVAVPVNTAHRGELLRHVLADSNASTLIIDAAYADRVTPLADRLPGLGRVIVRGALDRPVGKPTLSFTELLDHGAEPVRRPVAFSDLQAIMYTSGSTGPSKGAMCSHALALTCAIDSLDYLDRWGATIYCPLPLFHAAGLWDGVFSAMVGGGAIAITDRFHASRFWEDVRTFDAEVCMSVFSMIPILMSKPPTPQDKDHPLKTFYMGKSVLDAPLLDRFGVHSAETYTSTEAGIVTGSPYGEWRLGSCGTPNDRRFEVGVVDDQDRLLGPDEPGEIVVRPKQPFVITTGYYGAAEATAEAFRNLWYHTGDRGYRDADGYYFFLDRMKDAIRRRGENISAFDIECEVNLHASVVECAATGVPSELEDEDVKLTVVLRPGTTLEPDELVAYCEDRLPRFMVPRYVEFVDALPRTPTDKVAKYKLKERGEHGLTLSTWDREAVEDPGAERTA
ncbi:MAG TPA: AMP-binding protein [Pseudonocardiaceae bacterium]|jgi:crotonobetaine/carnitine-CoA ligase|nr:AMP-binding protein [Pseudonocardiaceae bacterium]